MDAAYTDFLSSKRVKSIDSGFTPEDGYIPDFLYPFQKEILAWALRKGRAAVFADCGLGKTPIQLAWANAVTRHTGRKTIILAPLAVSQQTKREGQKFGIEVDIVRDNSEVNNPISITNYEMLHHFKADDFGAIVLDESSILKGFSGKLRKEITEFASKIEYRLACTATPAPNDIIEITNHSEFLGGMSGKEIIALYMHRDGNTTHAWKLKGHAERDFWNWLASWSFAIRSPIDLGYQDDRFKLPDLRIHQHIVDGHIEEGLLFPVEANTMQERRQARRESLSRRVGMCASLANSSDDPWLIWCDLNLESDALTKSINGAVEVKGSDDPDDKADRMMGFSSGLHRVLVTKPSIAGFGMNWQHCNKMAFVGLSDSFEQFYQATRRCWRFGQTKPVDVHVIVADTEGAVVSNIQRKQQDASRMMDELVKRAGHRFDFIKSEDNYNARKIACIPAWMEKSA